MILNHPKPKLNEKRWYVYANPRDPHQRILQVTAVDVGSEMAEVIVNKVIIDIGFSEPAEPGDAFEVPWKRRLPADPFEAKKTFIYARFTGALM